MQKRNLVVMKFGGTSVADLDKLGRASERAIAARRRGLDVVVVVSAPGEMTDELLDLAHGVDAEPDSRELDMLLATGEQVSIALFAMACHARGAPAISLTGPQAGIRADERHTRSTIVAVKPAKIISELRAGKIVAVAGFQGLNPRSDITTLGRGGSDLSAVALAAALKAGSCEIYTDVKGVYTADPRLVPHARKLARISYDEMLELGGAQVMQARSISAAQRFGVKIHVRSSFHSAPGTWITNGKERKKGKASVSSLALDKVGVHDGVAKITVVGTGLRRHPNVADTLLATLAKHSGHIQMFSTSDLKISCAVDNKQAETALRALHKALGLDSR